MSGSSAAFVDNSEIDTLLGVLLVESAAQSKVLRLRGSENGSA